VQTIIRYFIVNQTQAPTTTAGGQPSFLLLLSTAQLCQLAGDTQCASDQGNFNTVSMTTKLQSGNVWNIMGQVKNTGTTTQNGLQVTADFYDSGGNNVGGNKTVAVSPSNLSSQQTGTFIITAPIADMKGTASFIRLEYESNP
jgi:hypothetical protein